MYNDIEKRVYVLKELGNFLRMYVKETEGQRENINNELFDELDNAIKKAEIENHWFTRNFQLYNLKAWGEVLKSEIIESWVDQYPELKNIPKSPKKVGLILAGNIPLVGLHDILCVLLSGNIALTRLSSKDRILYPLIKKIMTNFDNRIEEQWIIVDDQPLKGMDAVIATGSSNSARYFEYYFGKYPNIIRKNRNSVAVLTGEETIGELNRLADDIFLYFGLGCRNVSKVYVPADFTPEKLYPALEHYSFLYQHNKYANNYDYQRAILLVNRIHFFDNGFLILKNNPAYSSPVGTLHFEAYASENDILEKLEMDKDQIQCIIGDKTKIPGAISFGESQLPGLNDYADNIDTLKFLINLSKN